MVVPSAPLLASKSISKSSASSTTTRDASLADHIQLSPLSVEAIDSVQSIPQREELVKFTYVFTYGDIEYKVPALDQIEESSIFKRRVSKPPKVKSSLTPSRSIITKIRDQETSKKANALTTDPISIPSKLQSTQLSSLTILPPSKKPSIMLPTIPLKKHDKPRTSSF